jgi:hypothetical protein
LPVMDNQGMVDFPLAQNWARAASLAAIEFLVGTSFRRARREFIRPLRLSIWSPTAHPSRLRGYFARSYGPTHAICHQALTSDSLLFIGAFRHVADKSVS